MPTSKGQGVTMYLRNSTAATVTSYVLCATSVSGGGVESETIEVEPCLQDTTVERTTQDRKYTAITMQVKEQFGTATTEVSQIIASLVGSTNDVTLIKKIPTSTPVYQSKIGKVVRYDPDDVDRGQDMTATFVFQPNSDWTNSTTAPAT